MITYHQNKGSLKIVIYPSLRLGIRLGYWIMIIAFSILILVSGFYLFKDLRWLFYFEQRGLVVFGMFIILCVLNYVLIRTVLSKEVLKITNRDITYKTGFLVKNALVIPRSKIIELKYADGDGYTKHPLEPQGFDYLGIGTSEKEIQFLIKEGNLEMVLKNGRYRFGRNVYSEDADELIKRIINFA